MSASGNAPGQAQLAYRARTYATSLAAMKTNLRRFAIPSGPNAGTRPLAALTTRDSDDPAIGLLDAWAMVIDVLTFYQERIANEGYLRTATERLSMVELARAVGYELNPGVAATAYLAFAVEDAAGAPGVAAVPAGTQIQSVPGQGQLPRVFETTASITACAEWNALRPQLTQPQSLPGTGSAIVKASALTLAGNALGLQPGALLWVAGKAVHVAQTSVDLAGGTTTVRLFDGETVALATPPARPTSPAPPLAPGVQLPLLPENVRAQILAHSWQAPDLEVFMRQVGWDPGAVAGIVEVLTAPATTDTVLAFGQQSGFLGWTSAGSPGFGVSTSTTTTTAADGTTFVTNASSQTTSTPGGGTTTTTTSVTSHTGTAAPSGSTAAPSSPTIWQGLGLVLLERSVPGITAGSSVVLVDTSATNKLPPARYDVAAVSEQLALVNGVNNKVTSLTFTDKANTALFPLAATVAQIQSRALSLASVIPLGASQVSSGSVLLDHMALGLQPGQLVALTGQRVALSGGAPVPVDPHGVTRTEIRTLASVEHAGGLTKLSFTQPLEDTYDAATVVINANVAPATHGETVAQEVLGSGDGSQENQSFVLSKPGLTFVPAPTASGGDTTLTVSVNGVPWEEVPTLFQQPGHGRSYTTRTDDQGRTSVIFGDGQSGARLPTGQENVTATYRAGVGPDGNVDAGSLMLLFNRPLGVRGVQNPLPASGGVAPEALEHARAGAPLAVRTLGRIVTLSDYEDFARDFAGVGKTQATALLVGGSRLAHLTVAPTDGVLPADPDAFVAGLQAAIAALADPAQESVVDLCNTRYFGVTATLTLQRGADPAATKAAAQLALESAFGFGARGFGQHVRAAEVIVTLQSVPGVLGVAMQPLAFTDGGGDGNVLLASPASVDAGGHTRGADLILLSPTHVSLKP